MKCVTVRHTEYWLSLVKEPDSRTNTTHVTLQRLKVIRIASWEVNIATTSRTDISVIFLYFVNFWYSTHHTQKYLYLEAMRRSKAEVDRYVSSVQSSSPSLKEVSLAA